MTTNIGTLYPQARMTTLYYGCEADLGEPCAVRLDGEQIRVEYVIDGERSVYQGKALASGHFELRCPEFDGHATLHRIPGSMFLEGSWAESGERGMWRIELGAQAGA